MQYAAKIETLESGVSEDTSHLSAFIVYECLAAGKRAKEVCDRIVEKLSPGRKIEIELCSFNSLRLLRLRRHAAASVSKANLMIFSCRDENLPAQVRKWTGSCLSRPARPAALVALLAREAKARGAADQYLARMAHQGGLDYFSHVYDSMDEHRNQWAQPSWTKGSQ